MLPAALLLLMKYSVIRSAINPLCMSSASTWKRLLKLNDKKYLHMIFPLGLKRITSLVLLWHVTVRYIYMFYWLDLYSAERQCLAYLSQHYQTVKTETALLDYLV